MKRTIGRILMVAGLIGGIGCLVAGAFFSDFRLGGTPRCVGDDTSGCELWVAGEITFTGEAGEVVNGDRRSVPIRFTATEGGESESVSLAMTADERAFLKDAEIQGLYVDGELIGVVVPGGGEYDGTEYDEGTEYYSVDVAQGGLFQFAALAFTVMVVGFMVYWIEPRRPKE